MYCKHCGNKIADDAVFCSKCGNDVSFENVKKSETLQLKVPQERTQRQISLLFLLIVICTPFYKIYNIPALQALSDNLLEGYSADASFSFVSWCKLLFKLADEEEAAEDFAIAIIPAVIYFIIVAAAFVCLIMLMNTLCKNYKGNGAKDFWSVSMIANSLMSVSNIGLIIMKIIINNALNSGLSEGVNFDVGLEFLSISFWIYVLTAISIANAVYSNNKIAEHKEIRKMRS